MFEPMLLDDGGYYDGGYDDGITEFEQIMRDVVAYHLGLEQNTNEIHGLIQCQGCPSCIIIPQSTFRDFASVVRYREKYQESFCEFPLNSLFVNDTDALKFVLAEKIDDAFFNYEETSLREIAVIMNHYEDTFINRCFHQRGYVSPWVFTTYFNCGEYSFSDTLPVLDILSVFVRNPNYASLVYYLYKLLNKMDFIWSRERHGPVSGGYAEEFIEKLGAVACRLPPVTLHRIITLHFGKKFHENFRGAALAEIISCAGAEKHVDGVADGCVCSRHRDILGKNPDSELQVVIYKKAREIYSDRYYLPMRRRFGDRLVAKKIFNFLLPRYDLLQEYLENRRVIDSKEFYIDLLLTYSDIDDFPPFESREQDEQDEQDE